MVQTPLFLCLRQTARCSDPRQFYNSWGQQWPRLPAESYPEQSAWVSPRISSVLFGERTSPGCLKEGDREIASRVAWREAEAPIFRSLKNQPIAGFGAQLHLLEHGRKGRKGASVTVKIKQLCSLRGSRWEGALRQVRDLAGSVGPMRSHGR